MTKYYLHNPEDERIFQNISSIIVNKDYIGSNFFSTAY